MGLSPAPPDTSPALQYPGPLGGSAGAEEGGAGGSRCLGLGMHLTLTLAHVCSGAAVTVETASAPGAAPSRCPSLPWGPQVRGAGSWGSGRWEGLAGSRCL